MRRRPAPSTRLTTAALAAWDTLSQAPPVAADVPTSAALFVPVGRGNGSAHASRVRRGAMPVTEFISCHSPIQGSRRTRGEPRVAAAAEPHKRRRVAAGTAVEAGETGGKPPPAGGEGAWTTVTTRRARRQVEKARHGVATCSAARKACGRRRPRRTRVGDTQARGNGRVSGRGGGRGEEAGGGRGEKLLQLCISACTSQNAPPLYFLNISHL